MLEGGKRLIVRGLVRQIEQFVQLGYGGGRDIKLVAWNNLATSVDWSVGDEVPSVMLECDGSSDAKALARFFEQEVDEDDRVAVMTDGFWSHGTRTAIDQWRDGRGLRIFRVGADANPKLEGAEVFEVEDFFAAMDGWLSQ
jgi:hypothetical protein